MSRYSYLSLAPLGFVAVVASCLGCSTGSNVSSGDTRAAKGVLKVLGTEYAAFVQLHDGRPPKDQEELVAFVEAKKSRIVGLEKVEQLFQSPRDNQPLVIHYGDSMPPIDESGFAPIARESTGVGGKVLVANTRGGVQELSAAEVPSHLETSY